MLVFKITPKIDNDLYRFLIIIIINERISKLVDKNINTHFDKPIQYLIGFFDKCESIWMDNDVIILIIPFNGFNDYTSNTPSLYPNILHMFFLSMTWRCSKFIKSFQGLFCYTFKIGKFTKKKCIYKISTKTINAVDMQRPWPSRHRKLGQQGGETTACSH